MGIPESVALSNSPPNVEIPASQKTRAGMTMFLMLISINQKQHDLGVPTRREVSKNGQRKARFTFGTRAIFPWSDFYYTLPNRRGEYSTSAICHRQCTCQAKQSGRHDSLNVPVSGATHGQPITPFP